MRLIGFCVLFFLLLIGKSSGQEIPPIKAFTSKNYQAGNQNWGITQDAQNNMFFANNEGLLHFDGNNWTLYNSPNKTIMRSVRAIGNRIYTGCYMEFGYWEQDNAGRYNYTSISKDIAGRLVEDEQFWSIQEVDDLVLFQSLDRIYIYNTRTATIETVPTPGIFKMYRQGNTFYFQDNDLDFYRIDQQLAQPTEDLSDFNKDRVVALFPTSTGTLMLSQTSGFYRLTPDGYTPWATALDTMANDLRVYDAIQLANGNFAVGTVAYGLLILDSEGNLLTQFTQRNGLSNNTVLALYEDADNNLWAGLDNGIDVLNINAPLKIYTDINGTIGSVYSALEHEGRLYLGTNQGLFYRAANSTEDFKRIDGTNGQVWELRQIDGELFCAHNDGTLLVTETTATMLSDHSGSWTFLKAKEDPNKILVGNYQGISVLSRENNTWQFDGVLDNFAYSARFLFYDADGDLWVNHEYKGVYKLKLDLDKREITQITRDTTLPLGKNSGMVRYKDRLVYGTESGVYVKDSGSGFERDSLLSAAYLMNNQYVTGQLDVDQQDNLWLFGANQIKIYGPSSFGRSIVMKNIALSEDIRNQVIGFEEVGNTNDGNHILGTTSGYLTLDISGFVPRLNTVYIGNGYMMSEKGERRDLTLTDAEFESSFNSLHIELHTPNYDTYLSKEFRYRLMDFREQWSSWSPDNTVVFENLPPGDYTLEAQSRVGLNPSSNTATMSFTIAKPWYASNWAVGCYVVLGLISMLVVNEVYRRRYKKQKQKIEHENNQQLELERLKNEKQSIALKNATLERDMASKNQELATATMGMARKNEALQGIKKDLDKIDEQDARALLKRVKSIIEENLNDSSDWELFQKAFNNVDKDFIKTLKNKYPKLTPNDLKLCTYLRLNLSSKEIAPLLNISVRSVEISRYRLRKKMELPSGINLVDHILSI
ncbi:two-component regulator propeller domain-containing protein [Gilvibacter sediminis]|uniref:two-component regulator propeller domain-containing protein n=1 Tax=Gilvibacter sediminis TaxID=379071 RepID=UPI0023505C1A|nr:triple tyrosine motif-containing protein [Gilvibacter sediminis]MDC7998077.1 triple tyrosine motif-containing protein [Gilvibacter sediminis]